LSVIVVTEDKGNTDCGRLQYHFELLIAAMNQEAVFDHSGALESHLAPTTGNFEE
jgi:hypothetical protein